MLRIARTITPAVLVILALGAPAELLIGAGTAHAAISPEQKCQKGRYNAAAKYTACHQKVLAKNFGGIPAYFSLPLMTAVSKCREKYTATWPKLQKKAAGTGATCDAARFVNDGTTITDNLTGLQWEQKTDDVTVHDKDNTYTWSTSSDGDVTDEDGTAFTSFLATLNSGGCFAGQCDWRLPTVLELETILLEPFQCTTSPCIDVVFGPTVAGIYWSATSLTLRPDDAWYVYFGRGDVYTAYKNSTRYVRAVRGGL